MNERVLPTGAAAAAPGPPAALHLVCAGLLACAVAFVPHAGPAAADDFMAPREMVLHATAVGAGLLCLFRAGAARIGTEDLLCAAFALLGLVSYRAVATNPWLGARAFGLTSSGVALFWCARSLARDGWHRELTGAAAIAAVLLAATALLEAYGGVSLSQPGRAPGGVLGHRNSAAHLLVLGLPLLALHAGRARRRGTLLLACAGSAASAAVIVLSRSRGAWLAAAAVGAFAAAALFLGGGGRAALLGPRARAVALALAVGIVGAVVLPNRLGWRSGSSDTLRRLADYSSGSGQGRLVQYARTLGMVKDHPLLGVGPGNWTIEYPRYAAPNDPSYHPRELVPTSRLPSGDWMGLAAERGIPALLLLALAGAALAARSARVLRRRADGDAGDGADGARGRALAALCVLVALAALGLFDPILLQPLHAFFICVALGALAPPGRAWRVVELRPRRRTWAAAAFVLLSLPALVVGARQLRATTLLARIGPAALPRAVRASPGDYRLQAMLAGHWVAAHRCDRARGHIRAARALFPAAPAPRAMAAQCAREDVAEQVTQAAPVAVSTID